MTIPNRALRGGPWDFFLRHCRSAHRFYGEPDEPIDDIGFRVVSFPWGVPTARRKSSLRGGSWFNYPWCRSTGRGISRPNFTDDDIGFRVICLPPS
jgi:formylglycine-generating enzyme required for sulfatase activity